MGSLRGALGGLVLSVAALGAGEGCAERENCQDGDGVVVLRVDESFSADERLAVHRAAARWNGFVGRAVVRTYEDDAVDDRACAVTSSSKPHVYFKPPSAWAQAIVWPENREIEVAASFNCHGDEPMGRRLECLETTVMHEMGHLVLGRDGLLAQEHVPTGSSGIMQENGSAPDFTPADLDLCRAVGVCR